MTQIIELHPILKKRKGFFARLRHLGFFKRMKFMCGKRVNEKRVHFDLSRNVIFEEDECDLDLESLYSDTFETPTENYQLTEFPNLESAFHQQSFIW